jgi:gliding motility associated protien GldN
MTNRLSLQGLRYCALLTCLLSLQLLGAQSVESEIPTENAPLDDITSRSTIRDRNTLKPAPIREADIFWEKRIWRVIDTREKMNKPFVAPESPLFVILMDAALQGDMRVYSTVDDRFSKPLSTEDVSSIMYKEDTIVVFDPQTGDERVQIVKNEINWENVKRFRVKESWYFDANTSSLKVRILGIAPLIDVVDEDGNFRFEKPLFWVYYPQAREILARHKVVTPGGNFASTLSWEDWMEMRYFSSFITKENTVGDLRLEDTYTGVDLLMKSKEVGESIFNMEHDLFTY